MIVPARILSCRNSSSIGSCLLGAPGSKNRVAVEMTVPKPGEPRNIPEQGTGSTNGKNSEPDQTLDKNDTNAESGRGQEMQETSPSQHGVGRTRPARWQARDGRANSDSHWEDPFAEPATVSRLGGRHSTLLVRECISCSAPWSGKGNMRRGRAQTCEGLCVHVLLVSKKRSDIIRRNRIQPTT